MAEVKLTILGTSKDGFKVSGSVEGSDFTAAAAQFANLKGFAEQEGWQPDGARAAASNILGATPVTQAQSTPGAGGVVCQFDGTKAEGFGEYSAEHVATSRAEKMGKMGLTAAPVCGPCWNKTYKAKWDIFYAQSKPRGRY